MLLNACALVTEQLHDKANEKKLLKPGTLDLPLTGFYSHYQFNFLDRYEIKHQWLRESNCQYSKVETQKYESKDRFSKDRFFKALDIYEEGNSTKQRLIHTTRDFDRFVRAEYSLKRSDGTIVTYKGYDPICFESWWTTSNYIRLRLQKRPLNELVAAFSERYPEGMWSTKTVNNLTWRVQATPEDKLRQRPLNGVGGPYESWLIQLADTGYSMAIELGASKESLQYPDVQLRMQAMLKHLVESVEIEPIRRATSATPSSQPEPESKQPSSMNYQGMKTGKPLFEDTSTSTQEYPDKTEQLQRNIQQESNRDMKDMLRDTAPRNPR